METYYSKQQVIEKVTETMRVYNAGDPEATFFGGLTEKDTEIIGLIHLALPDPKVREDEHLFIGGCASMPVVRL